MARRMTPARARAAVQKAARDMQRAVDKQNRQIRDYNSKVAKAVNDHNRDVRQHNARLAKAVNEHNGGVRQYNSKVKAHNQTVENQRRRLQ